MISLKQFLITVLFTYRFFRFRHQLWSQKFRKTPKRPHCITTRDFNGQGIVTTSCDGVANLTLEALRNQVTVKLNAEVNAHSAYLNFQVVRRAFTRASRFNLSASRGSVIFETEH